MVTSVGLTPTCLFKEMVSAAPQRGFSELVLIASLANRVSVVTAL